MAKNLIIKTTMDNKDFDRKYTELTKRLSEAQKEQEKIIELTQKYNEEFETNHYFLTRANYDLKELRKQIDYLNAKANSTEGMSATEYLDLENKQKLYAKINNELEKRSNKEADIKQKIKQQNEKLSKSKEKINDINDKIKNIKKQSVEINLNGISKGLDNTLKKVSRWALALFGIRTAYTAIRSAIGYVSQYNTELAEKIESIKFTLAMALEPIIERIVNLIYRLVQYIGYLAKAWFNVDIFAKRSKKSTEAAAKATKSLAGFDTANVLGSSSGGSGGATSMKGLDDGDIPKWLEIIKTNGKEIARILFAIATALLAMKLGLSGIKALGIGLMIDGIIGLIQDLLEYLEAPTWENFGNMIIRLGEIVLGFALIIGSLPVALIGVFLIIDGIIYKNWDTIKKFLEGIVDWIVNAMDNINKYLTGKFGIIGALASAMCLNILSILKETISGAIRRIDGLFTAVKQVFDGIIKIFKGDFKNGLISVAKGIGNLLINVLNTLINGINKMVAPVRALIVALGTVLGKDFTMENIKIPTIPKLAVGGIVNMPGKGVPIGGAIAGEAGREGVLPLTDSQAMSELGKEIGKWINVNVDLTTKLDSRVLSRSLEKVQQTNSFMRNGV